MKRPPCPSHRQLTRVIFSVALMLALLVSCEPPQPRPTGAARTYEDAKDMFRKGRFDRALEFTDELATASPPNAFTERARLLRVVVFSGQVKGHKELAEAYTKGVETTQNPRFKAEYGRLRHDSLQYGSKLALGLGEVANQLTQFGTLPKELTLEAPYPTTEGPMVLTQLNRVVDGGWIEPEEQEAVQLDAQRKGINDALAEVLGGDRSKARAVLTGGPVKLDGADFAFYLARQLLAGASLFDRKHMRDSQKLKLLCNEADEATKAALALLKDNPNKQKEKEAKKLQDQIKTALKNF